MTGNDSSHATGGLETIVDRLRGGSLASRREFLRRSAAAGAGTLALSIAGSNAALAHETGEDTSDVDVLNFALTLEHLEYAFYRDGLDKFDRQEFRRYGSRDPAKRGLGFDGTRDGSMVRSNLADIRDHEQTHVDTLTGVINDLGGEPVGEACYDFGYDGVDEFLAIAAVLENTGVSAYDGAINLIENAELLTAGATIATVEARHASYLNLLNGDDPFPDPFDEPKSMDEILDAAGGFIVECD